MKLVIFGANGPTGRLLTSLISKKSIDNSYPDKKSFAKKSKSQLL